MSACILRRRNAWLRDRPRFDHLHSAVYWRPERCTPRQAAMRFSGSHRRGLMRRQFATRRDSKYGSFAPQAVFDTPIGMDQDDGLASTASREPVCLEYHWTRADASGSRRILVKTAKLKWNADDVQWHFTFPGEEQRDEFLMMKSQHASAERL